MIEIPSFALLFPNFEPYFIPTFLMDLHEQEIEESGSSY